MSLKNLLALQAAKKSAESGAVAAPFSAATGEAESQPQVTAEPSPNPPVAKTGLGLNLAGSKPAAPKPTPAPAPAPVVSDDSFSLEDLARMEASSISESPRETGPMFDDEVEATAPDRELPADLRPGQVAFVESLDGIYGVLHDAEMFSQFVSTIMIELQENEEYSKLVADQDVATMIRGMRRSMGLARVKKQEKTRKTTTNKNARKAAGVSDSALAMLDGLMGGSDD